MPAVGGGKRGRVSTVQSFASRRGMGQFLGKLDSASVPAFVTLTIPRSCCPSPEGLAAALAALRMRFSRQWPAAALVWKREHHASGVPHFHALVWLNSGQSLAWEVHQLQRWMRPAWSEILAVQSRVKIDAARDSKAVKHYASGYLWRGKGYQLDAQGIHWGKWWGTWNPDGLPYGERQVITGPDAMFHQVSRAAARAGYRGKRPRTNQPTVRFLAKGDNTEWARLSAMAKGNAEGETQSPPVGASRRVRVGEAGARATMGAADDATAVAVNMNVLDPQHDETPKDAKDYRRR